MTADDSSFAEWTPPAAEELGTELPGFRVDRLASIGGMAAVYEACQLSLMRRVAIKLLPPSLEMSSEGFERFGNEARLLAQLAEPTVVAVYDFGRTPGGWTYMVMEWVDGARLGDWLRTRPDQARRIKVCASLCGALTAVHAHGIVHGDIKPDNVLIGEADRIKLIDFGIAVRDGQDDGETRWGTPPYAAPEASDYSLALDCRSDLFSLAVMLWEVLTGEVPSPASAQPSPPVARVLSNFLSPDPAGRTCSLKDLLTALSPGGQSAPPRPAATFIPPPAAQTAYRPSAGRAAPERPARSSLPLVLTGLAAVAAIVGVSVWKSGKPDPAPAGEKQTAGTPGLPPADPGPGTPEPAGPDATPPPTPPAPHGEELVQIFEPGEAPGEPGESGAPEDPSGEMAATPPGTVPQDGGPEGKTSDVPAGLERPASIGEFVDDPGMSPEMAAVVEKYVAALEREAASVPPAAASSFTAEIQRVKASPGPARPFKADPPRLVKLKGILAAEIAKLPPQRAPEPRLTLYWTVDDEARIYINGKPVKKTGIAWRDSSAYTQLYYARVDLNAGDLLAMRLDDYQNIESFVAAVFCDDRLLFGTNATWEASPEPHPAENWLSEGRLESIPAVLHSEWVADSFRKYLHITADTPRVTGIWGPGDDDAAVRHRITAEDLAGVTPRKLWRAPKPEGAVPGPASARYRNSMGMEFLALPGQKALLCSTETRVRDYALFMQSGRWISEGETRAITREWNRNHFTWRNTGIGQEAGWPVTYVNTRDAQAFCEWLTECEQAAGWLPKGARYTLPSAAHYAAAWGGQRYPWGTEWPPPAGTANLPGAETDYGKIFEAGGSAEEIAWKDPWEMICNADAPAANALGFHGLAGNVWEPLAEGGCVTGSWCRGTREQISAGKITDFDAGLRTDHKGFRCVLVFAP